MSSRPILPCEPHLRRFRENDERALDVGLLLADDPATQRIAIAWARIRVDWSPPEGEAPERLEDLWEWLWNGTEADLDDLMKAARVSRFAFGARWDSLVACRAIFPDGSLARATQGMLNAELARRYPGRARQRPPEGS